MSVILERTVRGTGRPRLVEPSRVGLAGDTTGVTVFPQTIAEDTRWPEHDHTDHELVHVTRGVLQMTTASRTVMVTPGAALWVRAGVRHGAWSPAGTAFTCSYIAPHRIPSPLPEMTSLAAGPLLPALLAHHDRDDVGDDERLRLEAVLFDLLAPADRSAADLVLPTHAAARRVALALLRNPADARTLDGWGLAVGATARTLSRQFTDGTGLSFEQWRMYARVGAARPLLAAGRPTPVVARRVGYRSTSAFIAAFVRCWGEPPTRYAQAAGAPEG